MENSCNLCGSKELLALLDLGKQPIAHHFLDDPAQEEYVHSVKLCFCEDCGLIQLNDPVPPEKLYSKYHVLSSWKWNPHIPLLTDLIDDVVGTSKQDVNIVEVGCNDGSFLEVLREKGYNNLLGVEPAQDAIESSLGKGLRILGGYFTPDMADGIKSTYGKCDLFVSRQMLEHITDLNAFREAMNKILHPGSYVLIEIPNFELGLNSPDYSIIWEEHVNYFTAETFNHFLASSGIDVIHSDSVVFSGEALIVLGKYTGKPNPRKTGTHVSALKRKSLAYRDRWPVFRNRLLQYLQQYRQTYGKIAIYGAGCRATSLINFAGMGPYIAFVVDDQDEKVGKFMPGSRLSILPSSALNEHDIKLCLMAVNSENEKKVTERHITYQENGGSFASIHPPSRRLPSFWRQI